MSDPKENNKYQFLLPVFIVSIFLLIIFGLAYWNYSLYARYIFPPIGAQKGAELGQLGDYFGGLLNPVFGAVTIIFVFVTFMIQRKQLELAKMEHRVNLLKSEHRYIFSELSESLQKNGIDVGVELQQFIARLGAARGVSIQGDLNREYIFSYYKIACEIIRSPEEEKENFIVMLKKRISKDIFIESRIAIYCKYMKCMQEVSGELISLLDGFSGVRLSVESELLQMEEVFNALKIDYEKTALDGNRIVWAVS